MADTPTDLFLGGKWVPAKSGKTFETLNPANEEVLALVAEGDKADIDEAVKQLTDLKTDIVKLVEEIKEGNNQNPIIVTPIFSAYSLLQAINARLIEDRGIVQFFLKVLVGPPVRDGHARPVFPNQNAAIVARQRAAVSRPSGTSSGGQIPALATKQSSRPNSPRTASAIRSTTAKRLSQVAG